MTKKELNELGGIYQIVIDMDRKLDTIKQCISDNRIDVRVFKTEMRNALESKTKPTDITTPQPDKKRHFTIDLNPPDNLKSGLLVTSTILLLIAFVVIFLLDAQVSALQGVR